ncbi:MAG: ATP-binding protein [Nanoarchaeota archaeon]|nr:ATP-binding protein [Nanoarchaeota archaeon]
MILGKITGKLSTHKFKFQIRANAKKFEYVQVMHKRNNFVLAQIQEIEKDTDKSIATCYVIGYRDEEGFLKPLRSPFEPNSEVLRAEDGFIKKILGLESKPNTAYIGTLEGRDNLKVYLDLNKLLTKHVVILAKSGMGKSVLAGDIIEDLIENNVPAVIMDPHGEYKTLKHPNPKDKKRLSKFGEKPKGYMKHIQEFTPDIEINPEAKLIKLSSYGLSATEIIHMLPAKLSNSQKGVLYSALKNIGNKIDFNELIMELEASEESSSKWTLIHVLEYVKKLNLFSDNPTLPGEIVKGSQISIFNLKGIAPEVQEVIVYKVVSDLFNERKKGNIPPFFLLLEEAHNFAPERSFGEKKSSSILRQIASEGRKFGLGLGIVSQRPSRVDKSLLSQASTQFILKVTNPNDLKAISNSVEGITLEAEREVKNTPIGTALVTGIVDVPLFVNIRPRRTQHGGEAVKIFQPKEEDFIGKAKGFENQIGEMIQAIEPRISKKDIKLMSDIPIEIKTKLIPCAVLQCNQNDKDFNLLIDLNKGLIIKDSEKREGLPFSKLKFEDISLQQTKIFQEALKLQRFKPADLFSISGVQFSELYDLISILTKKGYFIKEENEYHLNDELIGFAQMDKLASYEKPDFLRINFDEKLEIKYDLDKIKKFLSKFVRIKNFKDCFLICYEQIKP